MQATSAILLAGGAGTRIRELYPDTPKPLVPVAGRPFLDWVCRYWASQGVNRIVLSLGYRADVAERYLAARQWSGLTVEAVREEQPLGTGGAIRFAAGRAGDPFVVANADSLVVADLSGAAALLADPTLDGVVVGVRVEDTARYGSLDISGDGRLLGFREKRPGRGWINGGVYFLRQRLLPLFPAASPLSMESDVFPALLAAGARLGVLPVEAPFLDIGTPESLGQAGGFIEQHIKELGPEL
jgi:D-glycero-alpha-D-manno-heptose 1-phosphate guanylyltransferase